MSTTNCESDLACQRQYCQLMQCLKLKQNEDKTAKCQKQIDNLQNCCDQLISVSKICEVLKDESNQCQHKYVNEEKHEVNPQ